MPAPSRPAAMPLDRTALPDRAACRAGIVVCPLAELDAAIAVHRPSLVVSLASPGAETLRPHVLPPHVRHRALAFHDVVDETAPRADLVPPAREHAAAIVEAARRWDRARPLVIHCRFGVSRSPAAAMIVTAVLDPDRPAADIARALRRVAPFATPNARLLAASDAVLGGRGLEAAGRAIGRGASVSTGTVFTLHPFAVPA